MPPFVRRILFFILVAAFFIGAAGVLFTANGYRYNVKKGRVEKTGELVIQSEPKGASVLLDGRPPTTPLEKFFRKGKIYTPARVTNLLSGQYTLAVDRDQYYPWSNQVTIAPGETTFVNPHLVSKKIPERVLDESSIGTFTVFFTEDILYTVGTQVLFYDQRHNSLRHVLDVKEKIQSFLPSPANQAVVIQSEHHAWMYNPSRGLFEIPEPRGTRTYRWSSDGRDRLYRMSERGIESVGASGIQLLYVPPWPVNDFAIYETAAYLLTKDAILYSLDLIDKSKPLMRLTPPLAALRIHAVERERLIVASDRQFTLVDFSHIPPSLTPIDGDHVSEGIAEGEFLSWSAFEVLLHELKERPGHPALITRQSNTIKKALLGTVNPYIYVLSENGALSAYERTSDGVNNTYQLYANGVTDIVFNRKSTQLYFSGTMDGVSGLFRMSLTD